MFLIKLRTSISKVGFFNLLKIQRSMFILRLILDNMHLGSKDDYEKALLDFQLQKIDPKKFRDLESYLKTNGLNKKKSVLFLHIRKELNYEKKKRLKHYSSETNLNSHHTFQQSQSGLNRHVIKQNTISQNEASGHIFSTNLPKKTKGNESPSTSQRVPCSLAQAIRNINTKLTTSNNTREPNECYLTTNLSKLPINTSTVVNSNDLSENCKKNFKSLFIQ